MSAPGKLLDHHANAIVSGSAGAVEQAEPDFGAWAQLLVAIAAWQLAALALGSTKIQLDVGGFAPFVSVGFVAILVGTGAAHRMPLPSAIARQLGSIIVVTIGCCIAMHAALTRQTPYADDALHRMDSLIGFDPAAVSTVIASMPMVRDALHFIYAYTMPVSFVALLLVTMIRPRWGAQLTGVNTTCLVVATAISCVMPAEGFMASAGPGIHGLPAGSGTFFLDVQRAYHEGRVARLTPDYMSGVISFPSYHVMSALIALQAATLLRVPLLGAAWVAAVMLSAIPFGGHHVMDLLGGLVVWCLVFAAWDGRLTGLGHSNRNAVSTSRDWSRVPILSIAITRGERFGEPGALTDRGRNPV